MDSITRAEKPKKGHGSQEVQSIPHKKSQPEDNSAENNGINESTNEEPTESILLRLPGELRNCIYMMALFHEEGGGVISPIEAAPPMIPEGVIFSHGTVLKGGHRFFVERMAPATPTASPATRTTKNELHEKQPDIWNALPIQEKDHYCTAKCLCQPPLTEVSVQIRKECLPLFYHVNKFHFEMNNFFKTASPWRAPVAWWHAIGDKNLRLIRSFNIVGKPSEQNPPVMVRYRHPAKGPSLVKFCKNDDSRGLLTTIQTYAMSVFGFQRQEEREEFERRIQQLECSLKAVESAGISVKALDQMIALIEPNRGVYL